MKTQNKPWIDPNGKPYTLEVLKEISQSWDQETWEAYLQTQEGYLKETLIEPERYDDLAAKQEESIFQRFCLSPDNETKQLVETLLLKLSPRQRHIMEQVFFEGKTERQIARELNITRSTVHVRKKEALSRLKQAMTRGAATEPYIGGYDKNAKDAFQKIDDLYQNGTLTKNERSYLWALAEVGGLRMGDLP